MTQQRTTAVMRPDLSRVLTYRPLLLALQWQYKTAEDIPRGYVDGAHTRLARSRPGKL